MSLAKTPAPSTGPGIKKTSLISLPDGVLQLQTQTTGFKLFAEGFFKKDDWAPVCHPWLTQTQLVFIEGRLASDGAAQTFHRVEEDQLWAVLKHFGLTCVNSVVAVQTLQSLSCTDPPDRTVLVYPVHLRSL